MDNLSFISKNKEGKQVLYHVIATYNDKKTNKDYIIFTDNSKNENDKMNVFYSLYKTNGNKFKLIDITDIEDEKIALEIIKEVIKDFE